MVTVSGHRASLGVAERGGRPQGQSLGGSPGVISVGTQRVPGSQEPPRNVCVQSCWLAQGQGADSCRRLAELGELTTESETPGAVARPSRVTSAHTLSPMAGACPSTPLGTQAPAGHGGHRNPLTAPPSWGPRKGACPSRLAPCTEAPLTVGLQFAKPGRWATVKVEAKKHFTSLDGKGSSREWGRGR